MTNLLISPTLHIGLVVSWSLKLHWVISASCSLFKDPYPPFIHLNPYDFHFRDYFVYVFPYPVYQLLSWPYWRIHCLPLHTWILICTCYIKEDLEFQFSTSGSTSHLSGLLCIGFQYNLFTDIQMVSFHVWIQLAYSHGRIRTGFYGFWWRPWVYNLYNLSWERQCHDWWHFFQHLKIYHCIHVAEIHLCKSYMAL